MIELVLLVTMTYFGLGVQKIEETVFRTNRDAVVNHWKQTGLLDDDELKYSMFKYASSFHRDVEIVMERLSQLEIDAPFASDVYFLPDRETCYRNRQLAVCYRRWLEKQLLFAHPVQRAALIDNINDTLWREGFWDLAYRTVGYPYTPKGKRLMLQEMRQMLGRDWYDSKQWPEPLPPSAAESVWD